MVEGKLSQQKNFAHAVNKAVESGLFLSAGVFIIIL